MSPSITSKTSLFLALAAAVSLVAVGCWGDDEDDTALPSPSPSATQATIQVPTATASPTVSTPTETATMTPTWEPSPTPSVTPANLLDQVVTVVTEGDASDILPLLDATPTECTVQPVGVGSLPKCPDGTPDGTLIPVIRATACEYVYPSEIEGQVEQLAGQERELFAIYPQSAKAPANEWLTSGDHVIVVDRPALGWGIAFHVLEGRIVSIQFGCGQAASAFVEGVQSDAFIVAPPA